MLSSWPSPGGKAEFAIALDRNRSHRVLVLSALLDEANKLRHFTVELMRALDRAGMDSFLPDLPGCNESQASLNAQDMDSWRRAAATAAQHFGVTHVLALRGGGLLAPDAVPGWCYAPVKGSSLLGTLLRARVLASREAGLEENRDALLAQGRESGLELGGHSLSASMLAGLQSAEPPPHLTPIVQSDIGGGGLWLRAEPEHDAVQSEALAARIARDLAA